MTATKTFVEAPLTLTDAPPRTLGVWAQTAMWASFGVTLFGPLTGALVALSAGSVELGLVAALVGTVIGALLLGASAAIGARLGTPSMVGLRGLLGYRGSLAPTVLNIAQNVGWAMMEIIVISSAAAVIAGEQWRWPFVVLAGALTTLMAIFPLNSVRILRLVMLWLVIIGSAVLFYMVLQSPARPLDQSGGIRFWPAVDLAAAQVISFCPLAATTRGTRRRPRRPSRGVRGLRRRDLSYYAPASSRSVTRGDLTGTNLIAALMALPAGVIAISLPISTSWTTPSPTSTRPPSRSTTWPRALTGASSRWSSASSHPAGRLRRLRGVRELPVNDRVGLRAPVRGGGRRLLRRPPGSLGHLAAPLPLDARRRLVHRLRRLPADLPGTVPGWSDLWAGIAGGLGFVARPGWARPWAAS